MKPRPARFAAFAFLGQHMDISVRIDINKALRKLKDFPEKQLPFAIASALTTTAQQTSNLLTNKLPEFFDRPTPYTMRAIGIERATKANLQARVFVKRDQLKYLIYGIEGGTRTPRNKALVIPIEVKLNQYGNVARGKIAALLKQKNVFSGVVNGVAGIWQRQGLGNDSRGNKRGRLILLAAYEPKASYRKRYPFYQLGGETAQAAFPQNFRIALANALRTAR